MVETTEMGETGGANVAPVGALTAVADNVDTHLSLGSLNGRVCVAGGHGVALGVEQEVVDQSLHVLLHGGAGRRRDLVVLDTDGPGGHLVQALVDDAEGLAKLFHADEIAVVAVTVSADGDIKFDLVVGVVGLALADVPRNTGTTEHRTGEGEVEGFGSCNDTYTPQTFHPDTVVRQHLLGLVKTVAKLSSPLVDIVEEADGDILVNTTGADVGSV